MGFKVEIKLLGIFRGISGKSQVIVELEKPLAIGELVQRLVEPLPPEFRRVLIDPELGDPRPNALILVNGREVSVLEGLKTRVNDGDKVAIVPVSHGG